MDQTFGLNRTDPSNAIFMPRPARFRVAGRDRRGVTGFVRERARPAPVPTSTSLTRCSAAWWCGCYPEGFVFYDVLPVS